MNLRGRQFKRTIAAPSVLQHRVRTAGSSIISGGSSETTVVDERMIGTQTMSRPNLVGRLSSTLRARGRSKVLPRTRRAVRATERVTFVFEMRGNSR